MTTEKTNTNEDSVRKKVYKGTKNLKEFDSMTGHKYENVPFLVLREIYYRYNPAPVFSWYRTWIISPNLEYWQESTELEFLLIQGMSVEEAWTKFPKYPLWRK